MTDKIKAAFEQYATSKTSMDLTKDAEGFYVDSYTIAFFSLYQMGYQQGQRDLVAGMKIAAYQSPKQERHIWPESLYRQLKQGTKDQESWIPLYRLPEVQSHLSKNPQNIDTSGGHGDGVDI